MCEHPKSPDLRRMVEAIERDVAQAVESGVPKLRIALWLDALATCLRAEEREEREATPAAAKG